jgi:SAM-dependent MidA family methyltransferase
MDIALYHPDIGYYARAAQRSGRAGDFFTSVDVGPIFGELLEVQIAEMADLLDPSVGHPQSATRTAFDLVEAGAGNGRLAADILRAAQRREPAALERIRLHLVEASAEARAAQRATLGEYADRLVSSSDSLPDTFAGVVIANELLDALPIHQVVMRENGLREVYVDVDREDRLVAIEASPSTPALEAYLDRLGVKLEIGWRAEINLRAVDWIRDAARRLTRGFIVLIDYGHEAAELYSATHSAGTLTTFVTHTMEGPEPAGPTPGWLRRPGGQDITAHVDFTSVRAAAESAGMTSIAFLDQTYLILGLLPAIRNPQSAIRNVKTLLMPGGLGSTHKVLILGKGVGTPALRGCSFKVRVT